jgi:PKD repeat protein
MLVARLGYIMANTKVGTPLQFLDESYGGSPPYTSQWSFGDGGSNATVANPEHTYTSPGTFDVNLTVTDNTSVSVTDKVTVVISAVVPSAPGILVATAATDEVLLSWTPPASNGGSAITNYTIYRGTTSGGETVLATIGDILYYTDTNVTDGQLYYYKVSAINAVGTGANSIEASATPTKPTTMPGFPVAIVGGFLVVTALAIPILTKKKYTW